MAVGKRKKCRQGELFLCAHEIRSSPNPFYESFNKMLSKNGFDAYVEDLCAPFYADGKGRPGVYFRMLPVGFLEGLESGVCRIWAKKGWDRWLSWAMRYRLEPMRQAGKTVK